MRNCTNFILELKWAVSNVLREAYMEHKLGITTGGGFVPQKELSALGDAIEYSPTRYPEIERMIHGLNLSPNDVFGDFGCGKGRIVFCVAAQKLKKVIGVELDPTLMDIAKKNLNSIKINNTPVEFFQGDAVHFDVTEGTVFYFYNPFGEKTFKAIIDNIKKSIDARPRPMRILYKNAILRTILDEAVWLIFDGQIEKTEIFVWRNRF